MERRNWTREETILALALYCKIPFGRINKSNAQIIQLAESIWRNPSALAMKMCNFGRWSCGAIESYLPKWQCYLR